MTVHASWHGAAAWEADPDLFFPVSAAGPALHQIDEAKRICRACPADPCLAWALDHGVDSGVRGGYGRPNGASCAGPRRATGDQRGRRLCR